MHRAQGNQFTPEQKQQYDRSVTAYRQLAQQQQDLADGVPTSGLGSDVGPATGAIDSSGNPLGAAGNIGNTAGDVTNGLGGANGPLNTANGVAQGLPGGLGNNVGGDPLNTVTGAAGNLPGGLGGSGGGGGGPLDGITGLAGGLTQGSQGLNVAGVVGVGSDEKAVLDLNPAKKKEVKAAEEAQKQRELNAQKQMLSNAGGLGHGQGAVPAMMR